MRHFVDGELTVGLALSQKPFPIELVEGDWHIVWSCIDGEALVTDYDEPSSFALMQLSLNQARTPQDKRKRPVQDLLQIELNFAQWELEYEGVLNAQGPATQFSLVSNGTPDAVEADGDAFLSFSNVLDDQACPFLQFSTSVATRNGKILKTLQCAEFVAKKTDPTGVLCLEMTKNERLRLGFPVDEHGVFEGSKQSYLRHIDDESYESLLRRLHEHVQAQEEITKKIASIHEKTRDRFRQVDVIRQRVMNDRSWQGPLETLEASSVENKRARTARPPWLDDTSCTAHDIPISHESSQRPDNLYKNSPKNEILPSKATPMTSTPLTVVRSGPGQLRRRGRPRRVDASRLSSNHSARHENGDENCPTDAHMTDSPRYEGSSRKKAKRVSEQGRGENECASSGRLPTDENSVKDNVVDNCQLNSQEKDTDRHTRRIQGPARTEQENQEKSCNQFHSSRTPIDETTPFPDNQISQENVAST